MSDRNRSAGALATLVLVGLGMAACSRASAPAHDRVRPAIVAEVAGSDLKQVTLTKEAAVRVGIVTVPVGKPAPSGGPGTSIPYGAVLYDINGATWAFTSPAPLVFVRHAITVERIDGAIALLSDGPPVGTEVVTVGAAELLGAELGVEGE